MNYMNRNYILFGLFFTAIVLLAGFVLSLVFFKIGQELYLLPSFKTTYVVSNALYFIWALILLRYYQLRKFWFPFTAGLLATSVSLFHALLYYKILESGVVSTFLIPSILLSLLAAGLYGGSLIFSVAGKRPWLKVAGLAILIHHLFLIYLFYLNFASGEYVPNPSADNLYRWALLASNIIPVFFLLNFWRELKESDIEVMSYMPQKLINGLMTLIGGVALIFTPSLAMTLSGEYKQQYVPKCTFTLPVRNSLAKIDYNSLLAQKDIKRIERKLRTPAPSVEAEALYRFLLDIYGKRTLSGQAGNRWGYDEFEYIYDQTGKEPAIRGMDFIHQADNAAEVQLAIEWWKSGGIPTIMWHWGAPGIGEGYETSKRAIEIDNCFTEGTKEHAAFWEELKAKADLLEELRDANVPVIWRPFHELNGHWFWYGKQGPERFKKLWITMYNYYVHERKLNNLIWNLGYSRLADSAWFPGDAYVDIIGSDTYDGCEEPQTRMFKSVEEIVKENPMPICYHECGVPPDPDLSLKEGAMWLWWMEWHAEYLRKVDVNYLKLLYHHELVLTKDELPDIMEVYGIKQ